MGISELLAKIGDENIRLQNLDSDAQNLDWSQKHGTKITFYTEVPIDLQGLEKLGLVIWLDRQEVAKIIAEEKKNG